MVLITITMTTMNFIFVQVFSEPLKGVSWFIFFDMKSSVDL